MLKASGEALNELRVDEQCEHVVEQFDVWEKATHYAGTSAQLRLQVLALREELSQMRLRAMWRTSARLWATCPVWRGRRRHRRQFTQRRARSVGLRMGSLKAQWL